MNFGQAQRPITTIQVARLLLTETGTYNPIYNRPYQSHIDQSTLNNLANRIDQNNGKISGALVAGVAGNILAPSATPAAEIPINLGWTERRIRFVMEVHVTQSTGSTSIYYFQGYTSHLGVTPNGAVDPRMEFIINSFIRVIRANQFSPMGTQVKEVVTESAHIVNGSIIHNALNTDVFSMRPRDIFSGIQSNYLAEAGRTYKTNDLILDTRMNCNGESISSNRSNNLPASYIANIIDSYQMSKNFADFGVGTSDIIQRSMDATMEISPYENSFIKALSNVQGRHCSTTFTFSDLQKIDMNVSNVTDYVHLGQTQMATMHQTGQTEYWNGSNRETLAATILSNAIPAIMMELMISQIVFRSTNYDSSGQVNTVIVDGKSLTNADISRNFEMFKYRLEKEVMFDITYGNSEIYMLDMKVDLFGESMISISIGGGPMITYTTPSFCDGLLTPIITMNKENFFAVTHDIETMINNLPGGVSNSFSHINDLV